jgi:hypothetical protein
MLRSILTSFARSYGRQMGRTAARRTSWLAIPLLVVVVVVGVLESTGNGGMVMHWLGPVQASVMHLVGR